MKDNTQIALITIALIGVSLGAFAAKVWIVAWIIRTVFGIG